MLCKYCNKETALSGRAQSSHIGWCLSNPKRQDRLEKLSKARELRRSKPGANQYTNATKNGKKFEVSQKTRDKLSKVSTGRLHSEQTKKNLSEKRKKWLRENPDSHPWKRKDKFISVPCESLKKSLKERGIAFQEEYSPLQDRFFSIDIAFPEIRLAIEVNGEQHYNRSGTLHRYYQERQNLLESAGWKVLQLRSRKCFSKETVEEIISIRARSLGDQASNF